MSTATRSRYARAVEGALLGTAVGDAIGLPYEGLSRRRAVRLLGQPDRHRFLFGRGMVSDDTEHSCMVLQALVASRGDEATFQRYLASRMRLWLLGLPAGIGRATLKATVKLWLGVPPDRSGVFSAGNGPAMRSAVLGAAVDDLDRLPRLVGVSCRMTHTDPKAEFGALAVALAARMAAEGELNAGSHYVDTLQRFVTDQRAQELIELLRRVVASVGRGEPTRDFADALGLGRGISGYVYHTVPPAVHACLLHPKDYRGAILEIVGCGGDADTTAAIVGGIVGADVGREGIPEDWLAGLWEWPRSVQWMQRLAEQVCQVQDDGGHENPLRLPPAVLPRNLLFLAVVLAHGFRRLLPPY